MRRDKNLKKKKKKKKKKPCTESTYMYTIGYARLCRCHINAISDAKQEKGKK
jgi:hypothetical protein